MPPLGQSTESRQDSKDALIDQSDRFDFYKYSFRQPRNLYRSAGWFHFSQKFPIDLVQPGKIVQIGEIDCGLYNIMETAARRLEDRGEVLHDLSSLIGNITLHYRSGIRLNGNLPRNENEAAGANGLGVGAYRSRGSLGFNAFSHEFSRGLEFVDNGLRPGDESANHGILLTRSTS